jgi:hypothetical protein
VSCINSPDPTRFSDQNPNNDQFLMLAQTFAMEKDGQSLAGFLQVCMIAYDQ